LKCLRKFDDTDGIRPSSTEIALCPDTQEIASSDSDRRKRNESHASIFGAELRFASIAHSFSAESKDKIHLGAIGGSVVMRLVPSGAAVIRVSMTKLSQVWPTPE